MQKVFQRKFFNLSLYKTIKNKATKKNLKKKNNTVHTLDNLSVINDNSCSVLIKEKYEFVDNDSKLSIMKGSKITYDLIKSLERINENNLNLNFQRDKLTEEDNKVFNKKSASIRNDEMHLQILPYNQTFS
jgi:hypothetical protein